MKVVRCFEEEIQIQTCMLQAESKTIDVHTDKVGPILRLLPDFPQQAAQSAAECSKKG